MLLYDQYDKPIPTRLLNGADRSSNHRPSMPVRVEDFHRAVPPMDWAACLSVSRRLTANNGIIRGAIETKAMHAIGRAFEPQFLGEDIEWGRLAAEWLKEWYAIGTTRGGPFDIKTCLLLSSILVDRDGEVFWMLTKTANGYPKLQIIPAHQVGQRDYQQTKIEGGEFKGCKIHQGIITAPWGEEVGYRLLGETPSEDADVSAQDMLHIFDPIDPCQYRGLCIFHHALNDWRDADQSQYWEQLAQLVYSSIVLTEHNESGGFDANDPRSVLGTASGENKTMTSEVRDGGTVRYFKAGTGSKIEAFTANRPGDVWDSFQDRLARKALVPVWPSSLVWKPEGMNGTVERAEIEKARGFIVDRQDLLHPCIKRAVGWAVSVAINQDRVPKYKGADKGGFLKWGFSSPPEFNIDHGREDQQWREGYKLGLNNVAEYLKRGGNQRTVKEHWKARAYEAADKQEAIAEVEAERKLKIDPREIQMFTPNDQSQEQISDAAEGEGSGDALSDIEEAKAAADAYGVGVRAGVITPNDEDETHFRERLGLPAINTNVRKAWTEDGGVRRPITLVGKDGGKPGQSAPPSAPPEE